MCPVFRGERGVESEREDCTFSLAVMPRRVMLRGARAANRELPTHSPVLWMRWHVCKTHAHTERENTLQWCNIITESTRRQTLQQTWWSNKRKCFWKTAENIGILIWHSWMQTLYKYTITVRHRTTFTILKKKQLKLLSLKIILKHKTFQCNFLQRPKKKVRSKWFVKMFHCVQHHHCPSTTTASPEIPAQQLTPRLTLRKQFTPCVWHQYPPTVCVWTRNWEHLIWLTLCTRESFCLTGM